MSPGVSSSLSKQLNGRENSAICLRGKQQRSIAFSLQLCFHTAVEAGCLALLNDTLVPPPPPPHHPCISPWLRSPVTAMIRERWDEYVRRDLILLNATSPVNSCQFCHCRFQAVSRLCGGGGEQHQKAWSFQQLHVIELSLTHVVQLSRGEVKQLTCDMSPQPSPRKESYCPSAVKVFTFLLLPPVIWVEGCIRYCLNTSCFFGWSPLVAVKDTTLFFDIIVHYWFVRRRSIFSRFFMENGTFYSICLLKKSCWMRANCVLNLKSRPCCFDPVSISIWCFYVLCCMTKCVVKHHGWGFLHYSRNLPIRIWDREVKIT